MTNNLNICDNFNKQTSRQADKQTSRQADKQTSRQADKQTSRQADKQTSRQADKGRLVFFSFSKNYYVKLEALCVPEFLVRVHNAFLRVKFI